MGASNFEMLRRIQLLQERLAETDRRFAALRGGASIDRLDLFGRAVPPEQRLRRAARFDPEGAAAGTPAASHGSEIAPRPPSRASGGALEGAGPSQSLQRGPAMVPDSSIAATHAAAVSMMLAGDLVVTVLGMRGLPGALRGRCTCHAPARGVQLYPHLVAYWACETRPHQSCQCSNPCGKPASTI